MKDKTKIKYNGGAAMMMLVVFFVLISMTILIGIVTPTVREFKIATDSFKSKQTYFLAESGIEDVLYRLRNSKQTGTEEVLVLDDSQTVTTITTLANNRKQLISLGDMNSIQRKVSVILDTGVGAAFSYGVQVGSGGFIMDNNSQIVGSVYSNGTISGSGSITGSATSANSPALSSDQINGTGTPAYDISFGNDNSTQDFSQSFQISTTGVLNKIGLYIKKVGSPSNITVRIVTDGGGKPSTTTLTSATVDTSIISTNYGWIDVPMTSFIQLSSGTTYWLVLDASTSNTKYYKIGANDDGYINGIGKVGAYSGTWNNTSPAGLDSFFSVYLGGLMGSIEGITVGTGTIGNAYSHSVNDAIIRGINYCQVGTGNNKSCNTSKTDPVQIPMPISEQNVLDWKDAAALGGIITGNHLVSSNTTLGPKKITGNLTIDGGSTLTMSGNIWVQGNLLVDNNSKIKLHSSYGTSEGVIIVDGTIEINNNGTFEGSGATGSYMLALTTSSSTSAVNLSNNAGAVAVYAANGTINVLNNGTAISLTGHNIHLSENAVITYQEGLANSNFVSGPSGTWNIDTWKEVE